MSTLLPQIALDGISQLVAVDISGLSVTDTSKNGGDRMTTDSGWHFVGETLRNGEPVPADGVWLEHDGPVVMCRSGLHYSREPFDALQYAPGPILCRVEIEGCVEYDNDKGVARRRMIVARRDVSALCREFARSEARKVLHLLDAPAVVREYLESGDESQRDAARAAGDAAWDAGDAAWDAARAAARKDFSARVLKEFGI